LIKTFFNFDYYSTFDEIDEEIYGMILRISQVEFINTGGRTQAQVHELRDYGHRDVGMANQVKDGRDEESGKEMRANRLQ
jgi:hypothetical protein